MTISDHPMSPSGVGTQTRYVCEALLKTGKFEIYSIAGAVKHDDYTPKNIDPWGDSWKVFPVDGYGDQDKLRSFIRMFKPDILYFMTDPRFYEWLWQIEDEVRESIPMVYYHVWDNKPYPHFNKVWYDSNDVIATISKVTSDIVQTVAPNVKEQYVPHAVNSSVFKLRTNQTDLHRIKEFRDQTGSTGKFLVLWNNRNARRKQSGTLIFWFKEFLDKVGHDKAVLFMHTDVRDPHGQPLDVVANELGLNNGEVVFSPQKVSSEHLAIMYNAADVTVNISDAEGFGLGTLESLSCHTPIIVNMTGGLQEQVTDGENFFGVGIEPASKAIIGSSQVPWIYEDRINKDDFINALLKIYEMTPDERKELGRQGAQHVADNYSFEKFEETWISLMEDIYNNMGSWENRKNYTSWEVEEV